MIHLGDRNLDIDTQYFREVKYLQFQNGKFDISCLQNNDFAAIYYPDIGMLPESILLSNIRIAPIQICGLGHPVSTFGSAIDYFISGNDAEINRNPEANYAERLVLLNGLGAINNRPNYPQPSNIFVNENSDQHNFLKNKSQFIINCPWYAQKVNYPLLVLLKKIAQSSNTSVLFRFFSGGALVRKNDFIPFAKDVEQALGADHVHVYPYMPYSEYMGIMQEGNICLDSYHFGGFNVIVDGLYLQKPSVLFEGKRWYSRAGAKLMKKLGLEELVAKSPTEYTQLTLKLINNSDFYQAMQNKVRQIDLEKIAFRSTNGQYFKKAIDYLIQNHEQLQKEPTKKAIRIS